MDTLTLIGIGLAFTAFSAFVFALLTMVLGEFFESFEVSGPDGWRFSEFYLRYLIIAAVYTFVTIPLGNAFLGIAAMAIAYKYVFDAGWVQALVIGIFGGIIAVVLFAILMVIILVPMGLLG